MGIRFLCPSCRNKVHVKGRLAGLRGFCPTCGAKVDIPYQSTLPGKSDQPSDSNGERAPNGAPSAQAVSSNPAPFDDGLDAAAKNELSVSAILPRVGRLLAVHTNPPADPLAGASGAVWYVVPPEGTEPFGPADSATFMQWMQQGRIVSRSLVWRQDWPEWRKAGTVWSHLALADVDPRMQRNAERARGGGSHSNGPQFSSPRMPTNAPTNSASSASSPAQTYPGAAAPNHAGRTPLMAQMAATTAGHGGASPTATASNPPAAQRGGMTAVPAYPPAPASGAAPSPPGGQPGFGAAPDGLYYPQRSHKLYWAIVVVLLIGLVGMSVALFYVLDQMKQHKQQRSTPTETISTPDESTSDDVKNTNAK